MRTSISTACLIAALGAAGSARAQNLIVNGSFEDDLVIPVPPGWVHLDPGSTALTGWVVTRDQIEAVHTSHLPASQGTAIVDLNGTPGAGGVEQTFATTPGERYAVVFDMCGNYHSSRSVWRMRVAVDRGAQSSDFEYDESQQPGHPWVQRAWEFTATAGQTTLEFYSLVPANESYGPTLDNVRVVESACGETTRYCATRPNSTGAAARIEFSGSSVIATNQAQLTATDCPQGAFGFFVYGQVAAQYPFGSGILCINPYQGLHRILPVDVTDPSGTCTRMLDFPSLPNIEPWSTWNFQFLFRDTAAGSSTFNSTDAVRVAFC